MKRRIRLLTAVLTGVLLLGLLAAVSFALVDLDAYPKGDDNSLVLPNIVQPTMIKPTMIQPTMTMPTQTLPTMTMPTQTLPTMTMPTQTLPTMTMPTQTLPTMTMPTQTLPTMTMPTQTQPTQTLPTQTQPTQTLPTQTQPTQTLPTQTQPTQTQPTQTQPTQTQPTQTQPTQTQPTQTMPTQTQPPETQPTITFTATTEWLPEGWKTLEADGRSLDVDEFEFELALYDPDRDAYDLVGVYGHDADGVISFEPIAFSEQDIGKEIVYRMREVQGSVPGMTYAYNFVHIAIDVDYDAHGALIVTPAYFILYFDGDGNEFRLPVEDAVFHNSYKPTDQYVHWTPEVYKVLSGRDVADGEFSFSLDVGNYDGYRRATNDADGTITFDPLVYTSADVGQRYEYTIRELMPKTPESWMFYDPTLITILVEVSETAAGEILITVDYPDDVTFNNHIGDGSFTVQVYKDLQGRDLVAGEFSFVLLDEAGDVVQTATNDSDGTVVFTPLYFTAGDIGTVFHYKVREVPGNEPNMIYASEEMLVTINVMDDGLGGFKAYVLFAGPHYFINTYTGDNASGQWTPEGKKILSAAGRTLEADEFSFELTRYNTETGDRDLIGYYGHAADGTINFPTLTFDETDVGKPTSYRMREVIPDAPEPDMNYDAHDVYAELYITHDKSGEVVVTPLYYYIDEAAQRVIDVDMAVFVNTVGMSEVSGQWTPYGVKILRADGRTLEADEFSFELTRDNTDTGERDLIGYYGHAADGTINFPTLTFDETDVGKPTTYWMREVIPASPEPNMKYDTHDVYVELYITHGEAGEVVVTPLYCYFDEAIQQVIGLDMAVFENTVGMAEASAEWTPQAKKMLSAAGRTLAADEFQFELSRYDPDNDVYDLVGFYGHAADGTINFAPIAFTEDDVGKEIVYRMREVQGSEPGMSYAYNHYHVSLQIAYGPAGELLITPAYYILYYDELGNHVKLPVEEAVFLNYYSPTDNYVHWTPVVYKVLGGRPLADAEFTFSLDFEGYEGYRYATNDAAGTVQFEPIVYTSDDVGNVYVYKIYEMMPATPEADMVYDPLVVTVVVEISETDSGALAVTASYPDDIHFTNRVEPENSVTLRVHKTLKGRTLTAGEFAFVLLDENDNVVQTATNASNGLVTFTPLYFSVDDIGTTFYYRVHEVPGHELGMVYSGEETRFFITVLSDGEGGIHIDVAPFGGRFFLNTYESPFTPDPHVKIPIARRLELIDVYKILVRTFDWPWLWRLADKTIDIWQR